MSAKTSGTDAGRDHNQGNQRRSFTVEQKTAVIRVRRCGPTAFYDILGLEEVKKTCSDAEIKKAYRKLSLLTHPDKNGYEGADEAFKLVSRAFQVLSDPDKKEKYDRFGGDPDSRFGAGPTPSSPFGQGFARSNSARQQQQWDEGELTPEELFRRFFGGGMGGMGGMGGFGPFDSGIFDSPGFTFTFGGGPGGGYTVHNFGGERPRRRPTSTREGEQEPEISWTLGNLMPIILMIGIPILLSFLSLHSENSVPNVRFDTPQKPYTHKRTLPHYPVEYFLNKKDISAYSNWRLGQLDIVIETKFINDLSNNCDLEIDHRKRLISEAQGWFSVDEEKMQQANELEMKNCKRCDELKIPRHAF